MELLQNGVLKKIDSQIVYLFIIKSVHINLCKVSMDTTSDTILDKTLDLSNLINLITCPYSGKIFLDPIFTQDGYVFEKDEYIKQLMDNYKNRNKNEGIEYVNWQDFVWLKKIINDLCEFNPELQHKRYTKDPSLDFNTSEYNEMSITINWSKIKSAINAYNLSTIKKYNNFPLEMVGYTLLESMCLDTCCADCDNRYHCFEHMVNNCKNIDVVINDKYRVINIAFKKGILKAIKLIIGKGANLFINTDDAPVPIYDAIKYCTMSTIQYIFSTIDKWDHSIQIDIENLKELYMTNHSMSSWPNIQSIIETKL